MKKQKIAAIAAAVASMLPAFSHAADYGGSCPTGMTMSITAAGIPKCIGVFVRPSAANNVVFGPSGGSNASQGTSTPNGVASPTSPNGAASSSYTPTVAGATNSTNGFVAGPSGNVIQSIYDYAHTLPWGNPQVDPGSTALMASMAREHGWTAAQIGEALGFTEQQMIDHFDKYGYRNFFGAGTSTTVIFTTGPGNAVMTPADRAALARRTDIQSFFNANESNPQAIMAGMTQYGVSAQELSTTMDYRINITRYLRAAGVPDGFGGLKVWDDASVRNFIEWQGAQSNPFGGGTIAESWAKSGITNPMDNMTLRLNAMEALDTQAGRTALMPSLQTPWSGDWRSQMAAAQQTENTRTATLLANQNPNVVAGPSSTFGPAPRTSNFVAGPAAPAPAPSPFVIGPTAPATTTVGPTPTFGPAPASSPFVIGPTAPATTTVGPTPTFGPAPASSPFVIGPTGREPVPTFGPGNVRTSSPFVIGPNTN